MAKSDLTAERLREVLHYNFFTGNLTWKVEKPAGRRGRVRVGDIAGSPSGNGYIDVGLDGQKYFAHRLVWFWMTGSWPKNNLDHINRNKSCNAWHNLREATHKQNNENRNARKDSTTGIIGVSPLPYGRWRVGIKHNYVHIHIGCFKTLEQAIQARKLAEQKYFTHSEACTPPL